MEQELTIQILDKLNLFWDDLAYNKQTKISYGDLILALLNNRSMEKAAIELNTTNRTLERILPIAFHSLLNITSSNGTSWKFILLEVIGLRQCPCCTEYKYLTTEYGNHKVIKYCKKCTSTLSAIYRNPEAQKIRSHTHYLLNKSDYLARNSLRRAKKLNATPDWVDKEKLKIIYKECPVGYHVDHIIPLQGQLVSGLHIPENLQYLPASENIVKSNKFEV